MKKIITPLVIALALSSSLHAQESTVKSRQARIKQLNSFYNQAEKAYSNADIAGTKAALKKALAISPKHGPSRALAIKLKSSGSAFKIKARKKELAAVILPVVDLQDTTLLEALETLSALIESASDKKVYPNFVIQDRSGTLKDKKVSLNMKSVPASVALEYLMNLANASAKFDEYAISVKPRG